MAACSRMGSELEVCECNEHRKNEVFEMRVRRVYMRGGTKWIRDERDVADVAALSPDVEEREI